MRIESNVLASGPAADDPLPRKFLMRRRSELLAHVQLVNQQYNLDPFEKMLQYACNRDALDRFGQLARQSVEVYL